MDLLEWVARNTYEFERITRTSGMSFFDLWAFYGRSFMRKNLSLPILLPLPVRNMPVLHVTCAMRLIITLAHTSSMFD